MQSFDDDPQDMRNGNQPKDRAGSHDICLHEITSREIEEL